MTRDISCGQMKAITLFKCWNQIHAIVHFTSQHSTTWWSDQKLPGKGAELIPEFSSVQINPLTDWVVGGDMGDESAEILFQSFLQEALVNSSGMGRDVHFLMMSIQHFLCQPWCHPASKMPQKMVLEWLLWRVTCPSHASFHLLKVTRRCSCKPTRKLILLSTKSVVLCSK